MAITTWNDKIRDEMTEVTKPEYGTLWLKMNSGGNKFPGINSFKFFLAYSGMFMVRDEEFYQGMKSLSKTNQ